jgi:hypothetical protein
MFTVTPGVYVFVTYLELNKVCPCFRFNIVDTTNKVEEVI